MAQRCKAIKEDGSPCGAYAVTSGDFCFVHSPAHVEERTEARRKGGQHNRAAHGGNQDDVPGQIRSMDDVLKLLDYSKDELLSMGNSVTRARALIGLAAAYTQVIMNGDFENRLERLEEFYRENVRN